MKVFLSWAGEESKYVAEVLKDWLPQVIQNLEPWMSTHIDKGDSWDEAIAKGLNDSPVGILCLTKESIKSNYLHYEAGAISNVPNSKVCTFLFGVNNADVEQPLGRFQNTKNEKEDILKLLITLNNKLYETGNKSLTEVQIAKALQINWGEISELLAKAPKSDTAPVKRKDRELLEEILQTVRDTGKRKDVSDLPITSSLSVNIRARRFIYISSIIDYQIEHEIDDLKLMSKLEDIKTHLISLYGKNLRITYLKGLVEFVIKYNQSFEDL